MSAATIITNATAGAPVLNGTEGSLSALFRYLAPILGWSIEFDSGPIIVVKPQSYKGGQALFYRIDDRAARGGAAPRAAEVRAYESMSDINSGSGLVGPAYIHKSYTADTTARAWILAGDQFGFFLNSFVYRLTDTEPLSITYLGFSNRLNPTDIPICVLFAIPDDGTSNSGRITAQAPSSWAGSPGLFIHKNKAGALNKSVSVRSAGVLDIESHAIGSFRKSTSFTDYKPWPQNDTIVAPIYINDGAIYSINSVLPAFARQSQLYTGYLMMQAWDGIATTGYDVGSLLISLGEDFRP